MVWLDVIPLISLVLLFLSYTVFGWDIASKSMGWSQLLFEQTHSWINVVDQASLIWIIHLLALFAIVVTSLALTAPITLMTFFVGSWLQSEMKSMISILVWSFLFVIMLRWFNFFVEFLVLVSSAILMRIELRSLGLNRPLSILLLTILCLVSFSGGAYSYFHWNKYV